MSTSRFLTTAVGFAALALASPLPSAGAPDWLVKVPAGPSNRSGPAMAYDSARGRVVLFGGVDESLVALADTWEWDGSAWVEKTPATSPSARHEHAMAYDSARGRVVLFGGGGPGSDTWEWDGSTWVEKTPATSPPWRWHHAMVFDSVRQRVVLFGGYGPSSTYLSDTWEWDGTTWVERTPAVSPPARWHHAMAYDSARGRVVLFGGTRPSGVFSDTWEWDGSAWVERTPAVSPPARSYHAMAFDGTRGRVVLFGGADLSDTWEWDGSAWVERTPETGPHGRSGQALAFDSARGRAVLFGGYTYSLPPSPHLFADTWEWNGDAWVERVPMTGPPARHGHAMAYDSARGRLVLFGGTESSADLSDTWEWDRSGWVERAPTISPPARLGHAMAYDSARGRVVLFGGYSDSSSSYRADTWEWDGSAWVERTPPTSPPPRFHHAMAYDSTRGRIVLFGGAGYSTAFSDTWEWNGSAWVERMPATSPPFYQVPAMAFDSARGRVVLVGGPGSPGSFAETWEWDGSAWIESAPATKPPARSYHAMAYDSTRGRVVLFGGLSPSPSSYLADTWEWDGAMWVEQTPATSPPARAAHAMAYDSTHGRVVLFGGFEQSATGSRWLYDLWEYGPIAACGHAVGVVAFAPGSGTDDTSAFDAIGPPDDLAVSLGLDGSLVLQLDPPVPDGAGADLTVHEMGVSRGGINENHRVEVSENGATYVFATICPGDECRVDLATSGLSAARYVRLTDLPPDEGEPAPDAGADIEGISVVACEVVEICNGIDEGDDGIVPPDEIDHDGDGYVGCAPWSGSDPAILGGGDCAPVDASAHPGAAELCDGLDSDCANGIPASEIDGDGDLVTECQGDCDDSNPAIGPAGLETCNQFDDNCNGLVDEDGLGEDTDGDRVHNLCDNCALALNPGQADLDADNQGDPCDLDDGLIYIVFHQPAYVEWQDESGFASWNSYRGDLAVLHADGASAYTQDPARVPLAARNCDLTTPQVADDDPPPGAAVFFLTTGNLTGTGIESSLGLDSFGTERPNRFPCP